jgi:hypothetical protein
VIGLPPVRGGQSGGMFPGGLTMWSRAGHLAIAAAILAMAAGIMVVAVNTTYNFAEWILGQAR